MDIAGEPPLEELFPNLAAGSYQETSDWSAHYNCIAWAAGSDKEWWWPAAGYYWPRRVPRETTLAAAIAAFQTLGYVECDGGEVESGFEKIVIYTLGERFTH